MSHLDPRAYEGGGEMILKDLLTVGERLGHRFKFSYMLPHRHIDLFESPDCFLIADAHNIYRSFRPQPTLLSIILRDVIRGNTPYIHFDNAYVDVCNMGYLPCNGLESHRSCPYKRNIWGVFRGFSCFAQRTAPLYQNAALNVFLSPLHRQVAQRLLGEAVVGAYYENIPFIDTRKFRDLGLARDIDYLYVGVLTEAKGLGEMERRFKDENIVLAGALPQGSPPSFGTWLGKVPYDELPNLYNRARNFVFLPRWPEPMGRVVIEAALCGCQIIGNDRVGALSFPFDLADPNNYADARERFWRRVAQASVGQQTVTGNANA